MVAFDAADLYAGSSGGKSVYDERFYIDLNFTGAAVIAGLLKII